MKRNRIALLAGATLLAAMISAFGDDLSHECTSWMVFSDLTGNNTNVLHKNRDAASRKVTVIRNAPESPRKWIGLGNSVCPCMGMNEKGLAGAMNSGEPCVDPPDNTTGKRTPRILQVILEECDTAAAAVEKLRELHRAGDYSHGKGGSIFFFVDRTEGFICEMTAKVFTVLRYDSGYAFRANVWRNPGMAQLSRRGPLGYLDSCGREAVVRAMLNDALDRQKRIDLADILALSRQNEPAKDSPLKRSVCTKSTNSASTLVIHREFPTVLSTMYALVGQPRHALYLPIPVCMEKFDCRQNETVWADAAWQRFDKLGPDAAIPEDWTAFEKKAMRDYEKASAEALALLRKGDEKQAVQTLNRAAAEIWQKAAALAGIPASGNKE